MNKLLFRAIALLFFPLSVLARPVDTTIFTIRIGFSYSSDIFPPGWLTAPTSANGEMISATEIARCKSIIARALNKYPIDLLRMNLRAVYFLKGMKFFGVGYGGTNSSDAVYVTDKGAPLGYTDPYIEQTFHHEFSSILFRNYPSLLDTTAWKLANDPGFDYNDPENGVGAIRNNTSSQEPDTVLAKKGMLTQYAMSSLENDVNTLAQNLFRPAANFWAIFDRYPAINKKVNLLINFYQQIDAVFTEQYFRKFNNQ